MNNSAYELVERHSVPTEKCAIINAKIATMGFGVEVMGSVSAFVSWKEHPIRSELWQTLEGIDLLYKMLDTKLKERLK